jgi:hypothetical protein
MFSNEAWVQAYYFRTRTERTEVVLGFTYQEPVLTVFASLPLLAPEATRNQAALSIAELNTNSFCQAIGVVGH